MLNLGHEPFIVCSRFDEEIEVEGIKVIGRIPDKYKDRIKKYETFSSIFLKNEIFDESDYLGSLKRLSDTAILSCTASSICSPSLLCTAS